MLNKSRGRPRGRPRTRERIAEVARQEFLEHGYRGATVRGIAAAAEVDSALISYHFGSKEALFGEVMELQCIGARGLSAAFEGDLAGLADRILDAVTSAWEGDAAAPPGLDGAAMGREEVMIVLRGYLESEVVGRLAEFLGGTDARARATAAATVIGGFIFTRYLNPLPSVQSLSSGEARGILEPSLRAALAPRVRRRPYARMGA
ncbi:TetR family transcriptional regulator [Luteipulveratus sp. YIM 133132]|uniref:TetR/AcrR family transcriptional regulator n=1 Tax=Luteipulveratus flavus TaxID=3031728 RepID=UPI0023AF83F6|nr:TetR/AcrR family transcriptional regulator [Luteipulveratus sp. YIM 133132]MDE9367026.1 TetR family transcriptional regulator [Luteipulveratus sp. YIM 133132]